VAPTRAVLHRAGNALALLSLAFVAWLLFDRREAFGEVLASLTPERLAAATVALASAHLIGGLVLALLCGRVAPLNAYLRVHWLAQIAKYAPGNIFHYVSRIARARELGTTERRLAELTLVEAAAILVAGGLVCLWCLPFVASELTPASIPRSPRLETTLALGAALLPLLLIAFPEASRRHVRGVPVRTLGVALIAGELCFAVNGLALALVLPMAASVPWGTVLFASTVSWIAGFLVPGAPGGIGIREVVALALLGPLVDAGAVPFSLVALRLCSVSADLVAYGAGLALPALRREEAPS
jgi:hypothetical protein